MRRLFNLTSALSLILCLATVALWVRSYWISDVYGFSASGAAATDRGCLIVSRVRPDSNFNVELRYHREAPSDPEGPWNPRRVARKTWNLIVVHGEEFPGLHMVVTELWAPVVVASVLPALWIFITIGRWSRMRSGKCPRCGYDLRATRERCPECGTPAPQADKATARSVGSASSRP